MLDPRIYRTGLMLVAFAVIVVAFSLDNQPAGYGAGLAPDAFNAQNAATTMAALASAHPERAAGSPGDTAVAAHVAATLARLGYTVSRQSATVHTTTGVRTVENVTGAIAGSTDSSIVILAHRDARGSPAVASLSGTAVELELARLLAGSTAHHTIVIASTSASLGAAGSAALVRSLPGPIDAVIALGDLAATRPLDPTVVPWMTGPRLAPAALRNTLAGAVAAQTGLHLNTSGIVGQLMHLAFPMSGSDQSPWNDAGVPAVLVSLSGERPPAADEPTSVIGIAAMGRAVLQSVDALDTGPTLPAPSGYLTLAGKLIPNWAIRLLGLALMVPVLMTVVDGLARSRRRGHRFLPGFAWVAACVLAFLLGDALVLLGRAVGALNQAPVLPVSGGDASPPGGGIATLAVAVVAVVLVLGFVAPRIGRRRGGPDGEPARAGGGIPALTLLLGAALVLWARNPFAALLVAPGLHLWMWLADPDIPAPRPVKLTLVLVGVLPLVAAVVYFALALHLSPLGVGWDGVVLIARHGLGPLTVVLWSVILGCIAALVGLALRRSTAVASAPARVTVRGPLSYAGPGSLGGTESALRR